MSLNAAGTKLGELPTRPSSTNFAVDVIGSLYPVYKARVCYYSTVFKHRVKLFSRSYMDEHFEFVSGV